MTTTDGAIPALEKCSHENNHNRL